MADDGPNLRTRKLRPALPLGPAITTDGRIINLSAHCTAHSGLRSTKISTTVDDNDCHQETHEDLGDVRRFDDDCLLYKPKNAVPPG